MPMLKQPIAEEDTPRLPPNEGEIDLYATLLEAQENYKKYGPSNKTIDDIWEEVKKLPIRQNTN